MQSFNLVNNQFILSSAIYPAASVLPTNSIILHCTPFTYDYVDWQIFFSACKELNKQISNADIVFIDACWDPFRLSNTEITLRRQQLSKIFNKSKVCILSACARHYYDNMSGCVYFPLFLMIHYPELKFRPRAGRIGCLNRRNAPHRVWLMHHLLNEKLIDPDKDVYSVKFTNLYDNQYRELDTQAGRSWFNRAQRNWPQEIATHPDNFPSDYSIDHPAWHTGIAIITETEPGTDTIICEKTAKGFLSKSCFSVYMGGVGYCVLDDLGFEPRFFPDHAEDYNIEPILNICRTITTESQAMEYRQMHIDKIEHNFEWFALGQGPFQTRPWWAKYEPKLTQALNSL